jgi:MATE family multidrug resistance protein
LGLKGHEFLRLLKFGWPSGLNWSFEFYAFILFINVVVAALGTEYLAAMMVVFQVNAVSFMPAFGLASAGAILVGQSIGAGRKDEVSSLVRLTFLTAAAWMGFVGISYVAFPELLILPFAPDQDLGGVFLAAGATMLALSALWQFFDAAGITVSEALRAAGDTAFPMWTRAFLAWGVFLPGSWYTVKTLGGGEVAAVGWLIAYLALLSLVLYLRFRSGAWRRIELVEEAPPV